MNRPTCPLPSGRFATQTGHVMAVQLPDEALERVLTALSAVDPLAWGDYDSVSFSTQPGIQRFRARGAGRNPATPDVQQVPCSELRVFTAARGAALARMIEAIYHAHPYEEPVILLTPTTRTLHIRGKDEDNPNRFWNRPTADWVPDAHR